MWWPTSLQKKTSISLTSNAFLNYAAVPCFFVDQAVLSSRTFPAFTRFNSLLSRRCFVSFLTLCYGSKLQLHSVRGLNHLNYETLPTSIHSWSEAKQQGRNVASEP